MNLAGRWAVVPIASLVLGAAWLMQGVGGYPQNSQYALVRALASGTPNIDRSRFEVGELGTLDANFYRGHYYSNKAPGMAFLTVPWFLVLDGLGVAEPGPDPSRMLWALVLFSVILPLAALLLVVRWVADRLEPGYGTAAAVTLGAATLVLPYGTLLYSHVLSALLVMAAFALLWHERSGPPRLVLVAAAGIVAGYAVTTEYPLALAAAVFGVYAIARARPVPRALAFGAGALAGVAPLLLYNQWAFGTVTHISYAGEPLTGGTGLLGREITGGRLAGSGHPTVEVLLETLFSSTGLLILAPVVACAAVGLVALWRRGRRSETLVVAAVSALFLLYSSSFGSGFGGLGPGPRYLIPALPLLALGLAAAFRSLPLTTGALGLVSGLVMVAIAATHALAGYDGQWLDRVADRQFVLTAASLVGVTGWYTILPFAAAFAFAGTAAFRASAPVSVSATDVLLAGAAVLSWALLAAGAPRLRRLGGESAELRGYWAVYVVLGAGVSAAVLFAARKRALRPARAVPRPS